MGDLPVKPGLDSEKGGHFGNAAAHGLPVYPEIFQPKGKLMPHPVGDNLIVRRLLHKADGGRLLARLHLLQRPALKQNLSLQVPVRRKHAFELPQQRGLAAARRPAQHRKLPFFKRKGDVPQHGAVLPRIGKREASHRHTVHGSPSVPLRAAQPLAARLAHTADCTPLHKTGVRHSAR